MTVALQANALTTLATLKTELGISDNASDDRLKRLINAASDFAEKLCYRQFYRSTAIVEKIPGSSGLCLRVARTPLNSITGIKYDGSSISLTDVTVYDSGAGLIARTGGWEDTALEVSNLARDPLVGTEELRYEVTYDGGWYTPQQEVDVPANVRTLPSDLEESILELLRGWWKLKQRDPTIESERLMSWSASYVKTFAPGAMAMLSQYRRGI